jgi:hypothetical protein
LDTKRVQGRTGLCTFGHTFHIAGGQACSGAHRPWWRRVFGYCEVIEFSEVRRKESNKDAVSCIPTRDYGAHVPLRGRNAGVLGDACVCMQHIITCVHIYARIETLNHDIRVA